MQDPNVSPVNALPWSVVLLAGAIFGVELLFMLARSGLIGGSAGGEDWRILAIQRFAFSGEVWHWMAETGRWPPDQVARLVTYPFVHLSFVHMALACVFVLALGKMVGEAFSPPAVLIVFFASAVVGALAFALLTGDPRPLVGGYPGAYGLNGAYTFVLWLGHRATGTNQLNAFRLIGILLAVQLVFGLFFDIGLDWVAEVVGFCAGFLVSPLLVPGALGRILERLRER